MPSRDEKDRLWDSIQAKLASGMLTEDSPVSALGFDSLDMVELVMEAEETGIGFVQAARIEAKGRPEPMTVGDLLMLLKTMRFQRDRKAQKNRR